MEVVSSSSSKTKSEFCNTTVNESKERTPGNSVASTIERSNCWFYSTYGRCKFGSNCRYKHIKHRNLGLNREFHRKPRKKEQNSKNKLSSTSPVLLTSSVPKKSSVCYFFKANSCRSADHCGLGELPCSDPISLSIFYDYSEEAKKQQSIQDEIESGVRLFDEKEEPFSTNKKEDSSSSLIPCKKRSTPEHAIPVPNKCLTTKDKRKTEIELLKKRYPQCKFTQEPDKDVFEITFSSSDPDWAFDVKTVQLEITLTENYPEAVCEVQVLDREQEMPPLLVRFLNHSIKQWLDERHASNLSAGTNELILRPLFKWLDRNLEKLFIEGLRKVKLHLNAEKAGIEFIPFELLPGATSNKSPDHNINESLDIKDGASNAPSVVAETKESSPSNNHGAVEDDSKLSYSEGSDNCTQKNAPSSNRQAYSIPKRGTEVKLMGLEFTENAASFECQKISVSLQCTRCKTSVEITSTPKRCHVVSCTKCHQNLQVTFLASLMHQHSNVLGYLHLFDCQVIDLPLPQCTFFIDCLNCNKRNTTDGIHYGQISSTWCLFCNKKMCINVQGYKFQQLQPPTRTGKPSAVVQEKKSRKPKDMVLEEGKPLPSYGTCKHYKKSHRWLRFPCCGKLYPCDICHNEVETDHEMKFASRMVCGFCSKEQPYSTDKPCVLCSLSPTKKSSKHWEGGKGCRDKIRLSKDDKQKYVGTNKTVSRKATEQKIKKKI